MKRCFQNAIYACFMIRIQIISVVFASSNPKIVTNVEVLYTVIQEYFALYLTNNQETRF